MEKACKSKEASKKRSTRKKLANRFRRKKIGRAFVISKDEFDFFPKNSANQFTYMSSSNPEKEVLLEVEETSSELESVFKRFLDPGKQHPTKPTERNRTRGGSLIDDETWTFSSRCSALEQRKDNQKKVFWKTSKLSFPASLTERTNNLLQNQNMLWRSLQHLQKFCEEKRLNVQQISEVFNMELQKIAENNSLQIVSECLRSKSNEKEPVGRKTRLSRWTFLGRENKNLKPRANSIKFKSNHFYARKRSFSKGRLDCESYRCGENAKTESFWSGERGNCSCEKCANDLNEKPSVEVNKQLRKIKMAPNSEEDSQIGLPNKRGWGMEIADKEPLRPPVYNPEDYATSLKKWGKKGSMGAQVPQYLSQSTGSLEKISEELGHRNKRQSSPSAKSSSSIKSGDEKQSKKEKESTLKMEKKDIKNKENINRGLKSDLQKDFLNPILSLSAQTGEMSLRQFSSVTELLGKLKQDLKLSFPSFVQEFVGDPIDGVTLLLELLRSVQLSQTSQLQRCPPQILRRALLDEHSCLVCLKHCLRCSDASRRLASSPAGLFTLAVCIMSNVTQSRIIALELLTKACEPQAGGHKAVSEALSTLRLRFGEPVRFRFLVGMLSSAGAIELLATAMKFINVFVESAPNLQQKIYIQAELQQAGFDSEVLRKTLPSNSESVKLELNKWEKNFIDIEALHTKVAEANVLQEKIYLLEKRIKILQEEKGILQSLEQCLKERCSELEEEVSIKTTATSKSSPAKPLRNCGPQKSKNTEKGESTPAEDEGISSSEQELSQDEDYVKGRISYVNSKELEQSTNLKKTKNLKHFKSEPNIYLNKTSECKMTTSCNLKNIKNMKSNKMKESNVDDGSEIIQLPEEHEEEETTIDEVIEELENIVNDAETGIYASEEKVKILNAKSSETLSELVPEDKYQTYNRPAFISHDKTTFEESEIVPAIIHPQPPKKSKSLVHIYFLGSDFDSHDRNKSEFFEDSDSESSDSLLTETRDKKSLRKGCHKSLEVSDSFNSFSSVNTRSLFIKQEQDFEESELNSKLCYEERNIDEEEIKRKHLKKNPPPKGETNQTEFSEVIFKKKSQLVQNDGMTKRSADKLNGFASSYDRANFFQAAKSSFEALNESPRPRPQKCIPTPVKRSQTFHMTSSNSENSHKKNEVKPKPKMGVSGLDFQRTSEQKLKSEHWKYQAFDYKKNLEKRLDASDRYLKKVSKDSQRGEEETGEKAHLRRGSFSGSFSVVNSSRSSNVTESIFCKESFSGLDKTSVRSKSVEKMDDGLDSLVDIVISTDETKKPKPRNDWSGEVTKNIGPRTRRSLAESSLFCPQFTKNFNKQDESPKPPKPAQRTSLARNNSSSVPLHLPIEIKLAPVQQKRQHQIIYNFGLTPAKSVDSLSSSSQTKRCPPDGSSSPVGFKKSQESPKFSDDKTPVYSSAVKPPKIQTFFGNPKFDSSSGSNDQGINHKYFETNYAAITSDNSSRVARTVQNAGGGPAEKLKSQVLSSGQQKPKPNGYKPAGGKDNQLQSKPNFLLGTYQSQSSKNSPPKLKISGSVLQSINTFNNSFVNRNNALGGLYSGKKNPELNFSSKGMSMDINKSREANSNGSGSEKVTDSPSGLY